jgi:nucleotide-binding universal stress UspA family protein
MALRAGDGVAIGTEVIEGRAAEEICLWARHRGAALTVLCTHGAGGHTDWKLASTARKLVEGAPGSVLLVPVDAAARDGAARYRRLLVPVDGSARAESVLPIARRVAEAQGAELLLAHVVPVPELTEIGPLDSYDVELRSRLVRRNEEVGNAYLDRLRAKLCGDGVPVRTAVLGGSDVRSCLAGWIAEQDVDLVVLSAQGRSAPADVPLGAVASHLVMQAKTPLLILRRPAALSIHPMTTPDREDVRLPSQAAP